MPRLVGRGMRVGPVGAACGTALASAEAGGFKLTTETGEPVEIIQQRTEDELVFALNLRRLVDLGLEAAADVPGPWLRPHHEVPRAAPPSTEPPSQQDFQ